MPKFLNPCKQDFLHGHQFSVNTNFRACIRIGIKGAEDLTTPLLRYMVTPDRVDPDRARWCMV